jgi:hypothetical protein
MTMIQNQNNTRMNLRGETTTLLLLAQAFQNYEQGVVYELSIIGTQIINYI